jgi:hypothetical protein
MKPALIWLTVEDYPDVGTYVHVRDRTDTRNQGFDERDHDVSSRSFA